MSVLLKDVMNIFPFSEARLVAGYKGINRRVSTANIQEVPYVERWLKGGEILFTSGYAFKSTDSGCRMMERLNEVGIAALAIKPGQYLNRIPLEMINLSNEIGLPLFELPPDLPYMDCIIAIFEHITQEQLIIMKRADKVHSMLTETILSKRGLKGISDILFKVINTPVFITTSEGIFLMSKVKETESDDNEYLNFMKFLIEEYISNKKAVNLKKNQCNIVYPSQDIKLIIVPVYVQNECFSYLILDASKKKLEDVEMIMFEQAGNMVALELLNEQVLNHRDQKMREQLLDDLLTKRYSDEKMIIQRGLNIGFDLTSKFCLFVIDADSFEEALKNEFLDLNEAKVQNIKIEVQETIRQEMNNYNRNYLILDNSVGVIGMLSVRSKADLKNCEDLINSIIKKLEHNIGYLKFSAGISRIKEEIEFVQQAYMEAKLAMRAGRKIIHNKPLPHGHSFDELGSLCFLYELSDSKSMKSFYKENIGILDDFDKNYNSELIKTLETYFSCNKNIRKTSEELYIHKNSVIYRLNKIELLLDKKLKCPEVSFDLQLCLKLKNLI